MNLMENKIAVAALVAMLVPATSVSAHPQQNESTRAAHSVTAASTTAKPVAEEGEEAGATVPGKPGTEGIKVHGHWLIDLKDKDGKVLEHRDFHNALDPYYGGDVLAQLISGQAVMSSLQIETNSFVIYRQGQANQGQNLCLASPPPTGLTCVPGLTLTYTRANTAPNSPVSLVTLQGSITPTTATTVNFVGTYSISCVISQQLPYTGALLTESPAKCGALNLDNDVTTRAATFTRANITPINVAAGQTLAITVVLSFS